MITIMTMILEAIVFIFKRSFYSCPSFFSGRIHADPLGKAGSSIDCPCGHEPIEVTRALEAVDDASEDQDWERFMNTPSTSRGLPSFIPPPKAFKDHNDGDDNDETMDET